VIQAKDVLDAYIAGADTTIRRFVRQAPVIPDTADALDAVAVLRASAVHIGLVHDEYGHFQGVVTNADILEAIVGAFRTEEGPAELMAVRRDDGSLLVSGAMPIDELADLIGLPLPPERSYHTVAGFALEGFRHIPRIGESFTAGSWRFEVLDLDGRRVDKLLVAKQAAPRRAVG
jgi:putative hemolysin